MSFWGTKITPVLPPSTLTPVAGKVLNPTVAENLTPGQASLTESDVTSNDLRHPYLTLEGSTSSTVDGIAVGRNILFPVLDGKTAGTDSGILDGNGKTTLINTGLRRELARDANGNLIYDSLGRPCYQSANPAGADFDKLPTALSSSTFQGWESALQMEYIHKAVASSEVEAISYTIDSVSYSAKSVRVSGTPGDPVTAVLSADGKHVYIVERLQKAEFAKMSLSDQTAVASTKVFQTTVAKQFGYVADSTPSAARTAMQTQIQTTGIDAIVPVAQMSTADAKIFKDELTLLKNSLNQSAVFAPADITNKIKEIVDRFTRANAFAAGTVGEGSFSFGGSTVPSGVRSDDHNAGITSGYQKFIQQESAILRVLNARATIASTGAANDRHLDVPNLIFVLQLNYNLADEAKNSAATEEVNQTNALLKTYAAMQALVNTLLGNFDTSKTDEKRNIRGTTTENQSPLGPDNTITLGTYPSSTVPASSLYIAQMFEDRTSDQVRNPIEVMKKITRPTFDLFTSSGGDDPKYVMQVAKKNAWDQVSTKLADTVTLLNQESQIKLNDINSLDKQKNRHFDLANNALSKMNDMIQSIARSVA